jgi:hypothetical protein
MSQSFVNSPVYKLCISTTWATKGTLISPECISVISPEKYCSVSLVLHLVNGMDCLGHKILWHYYRQLNNGS